MARRKVSSNFVDRLGKQYLPEVDAVKIALELEAKKLYLRAAKQWGVAMQENPSFAEYIAAQRFRCIELSNAYHSRRIELYDIRGDITTVRHKVEAAYVRLCIKENPRSDQM
ncbi:PerC family transcriptional regulator [Proteus vulgaris]|uniref:PerC family transcriptional regulator n=2 Tax=Morganellaceae TaxID=1903414 RepID=A0AAE4JT17_MORMO|nr:MULTISPECIES: PerC family transcriptional regulator [Morganellaceae]ELR5252485.1 PerC family transcriptional regulator [Providencia rettgeri]MDI9094994.1 PerC family transcriptional regulator [Providencia rettgeri]MDS0789295.1 PerC family transcriptional regulator [Proteus vulgaris]MDS0899909.1 PerC family transcriptional regulator [Morganella morganii]MDS0908857.1 PerC family transcriptional regulator [Morganella morganii]